VNARARWDCQFQQSDTSVDETGSRQNTFLGRTPGAMNLLLENLNMSKQSSLLANVSALLGAMVLSATVASADTTKSGSSMPMAENMGTQEKMGMDKETGMKEDKMGMEKEEMGMDKTNSMTEEKPMEMGKDKMKETMPMKDTKG
jgi:hypothetical protein